MYFRDHAPPHFHAIQGEHEAVIDITRLQVSDGRLPRKSQAAVLKWAAIHQQELLHNWALACADQPLVPLPPLP
jgi:hypothetical protein